ncbi:unnamed protein product [Owenia fusiformis]|uniref:Uncharacterized protein n=1 Tax=Owenia fusiformis TaxID=6347 RepID=A0A8J1XH88_OWEFU|nr:unnamed protein product [Owenia fusiformis]
MMLLLVGIEKYIMIMYPLRFNTIVTTRRMLGVIVTCWVYSSIIALVPIFGLNTYDIYIFPNLNETQIEAATWATQQCNPDYALPSSYMGIYFLGNFYPIIICLICLYIHIIIKAHKQAQKINSFEQASQGNKGISLRKYFKSLRTVIAILGYLMITWVPLGFFQLNEYDWLQIEYIPFGRSARGSLVLRALLTGMGNLNCVYNPIVCILLNRDMRHMARKMLCPKCFRQQVD